ncbi:hypothetical protein bcCo53_001713 (plasmid) [Borrelia coriaceae]|uniref:Lipoprotein n=1 Tax=Borrelia coriaceae ATCC 43381 TaxID=1408429 RepID=W5SW15_9SPIR|nr:hypothetical protein [Borrelia coriaceae]AHH11369.1 hypothetical protein BCO_0900079 [Borrelia coriaceae ATCC 43381]UPA17505.1 hypothetical protein bcCo53_001713 [Borrelia coriaceae]
MKNLLLIFTLLTLGITSCNDVTKPKKKQTSNHIPDNKLHEIGISVSPKKKENTTQIEHEKLTQENIKSLQTFLNDSQDYHDNLKTIYNSHIKYINEVMTYTQCSEAIMVFCTSDTNSQIRINAIEKLNNSNLIQNLQTLAESIKDTNPQELNNSIETLKQAINQAYLVKDNNDTNAWQTIRNAGSAFIITINNAITAYIDAFVTIVSKFDSNTFISAAHSFAIAAKTFHKEVNIVAFNPIVNALKGMAFQLDDSIKQIKQYAINLDDHNYTGGTTFANAIDLLIYAYKQAVN